MNPAVRNESDGLQAPAGGHVDDEGLRVALRRLRAQLAVMTVEVDRVLARASRIGRPPVRERAAVRERWSAVRTELEAGKISKSQAARDLGVSRASVGRLLLLEPEPGRLENEPRGGEGEPDQS